MLILILILRPICDFKVFKEPCGYWKTGQNENEKRLSFFCVWPVGIQAFVKMCEPFGILKSAGVVNPGVRTAGISKIYRIRKNIEIENNTN